MSGFGLGTATANTITVAGTLDVDGATTLDQVTIDTADGNFDVSGANKISLTSSNAAVDAIKIEASDAGSKINIGAGTNGISMDTTGQISLLSTKTSDIGVSLKDKNITLQSTTGDVKCQTDSGTWRASREWQFVDSVEQTSAASTFSVSGLSPYDMYKIVFAFVVDAAPTSGEELHMTFNNQADTDDYRVVYINQVGGSTATTSSTKAFVADFDEQDRSVSGEIIFVATDLAQSGSTVTGYPISFKISSTCNGSNRQSAISGLFFPDTPSTYQTSSVQFSTEPNNDATLAGRMDIFGRDLS